MNNPESHLVVEDKVLWKENEVSKPEGSSSFVKEVVVKVFPESKSEVKQELDKFYNFETMQVRPRNGVPSLVGTQSTGIQVKLISNQGLSSENLSYPEAGQNKSSMPKLEVKLSNEEMKKKVDLNEKVREVPWKHKLKCGDCRGCGKSLEGGGEDLSLGLIKLFEHVHASGQPNFQCCRIPVCQASLNLEVWREKLKGYEDLVVCDLLEYGFPLDFDRRRTISCNAGRNHKGARDYPQFIDKYFEKECKANRVAGPFPTNPLSVDLAVSPINTVPKDSADERRVIVDLSWPTGSSVNDGISKDVYLGEEINLHYASVEQVCHMVNEIGPGAVIYKRDLRHAYRQISVDPRDYRYLGYYWKDSYYFDTVLAMGQRNAAMACARTTDAIVYMHQQNGYSAGTNYLERSHWGESA